VPGTSGIEREIKLQGTRPLDLEQLKGVPLERRTFTSTYHDTADRLLERAGITLRRRLEHGKSDWQLKLPADGARREIQAPGGPAGPPGLIADLLPAFLHRRELVALATLRTARAGVLVRTGTGIAEVVVDEVAVMDGLRVTQTFDEVEIELVGGDERALQDIERALKRLGARRTDGRAKIARALGVDDAGAPSPRTDDERLRLFLAQRYIDILAADPGVRLGVDAEPVHDLRVAIRRLRTVLRAVRPLAAAEWADRLRNELDWVGTSLGPLRDLDVLTAHLRQETSALDEVDGAPLEAVFRTLADDHAAARAHAIAALGSDRYLALLDALAGPPALLEPEATLREVAGTELRRLRKTMRKVDPDAPDELLHRARIRAKRLRYVAEVLGKQRVVRRAKTFQDVVGEHQDAVVAEQRLRELAGRVPESAVALGRLIERERRRRSSARGDLPKTWTRLKRAAPSTWP
jgi:CHAD domain-containing protein